PIVVAVNKIDKPDADAERVRTELAKHDVIAEEWGGQNMFRSVSAKSGEGIDQLLEAILLQAEVLELAAPRAGLASGVVIESSMEKGRGAVVTVLVKRGTLRMGDVILAGAEQGRVRAMFDENGQALQEALPSMPVVVLGLSGAPNAGDDLLVVENERKAREVAVYRQSKFSDVKLASASKARIIGFNVRADAGAREALKETGVDLRYYSIIYEAIDDVKQMMTGMLQPEIKETILGIAQVRDVFRSSKFGVVAGCLITEGVVKRNNPIRVLRENVVIFEGALESLRRFKDDVAEVRAGVECGIGVRNYQDVRAGDQIECFSRVEIARALE